MVLRVREESEGAQPGEVPGQHVLEEAADEDAGVEAHDLRGAAVGVVLVAEGDDVVVDIEDAVVADRDLVGVAGERAQDLLRATERWLCVDDPFHGGGIIEATLELMVSDALESATAELVRILPRNADGQPEGLP